MSTDTAIFALLDLSHMQILVLQIDHFLRQQSKGLVVVTGSVAAQTISIKTPVYCASKYVLTILILYTRTTVLRMLLSYVCFRWAVEVSLEPGNKRFPL